MLNPQYYRQTLPALLASVSRLLGLARYSGPAGEHIIVLWAPLKCCVIVTSSFELYHGLSVVLEYPVPSACHHLNSKSLVVEYLSGLPSVPVWCMHQSPNFAYVIWKLLVLVV